MTNLLEGKYTQEEYEAIIAAYDNMSNDELLQVIRRKTAELGRLPKKSDIPAAWCFKHRFGPWPRVLEAAGVKEVTESYRQRQENKVTKRLRKKELRKRRR